MDWTARCGVRELIRMTAGVRVHQRGNSRYKLAAHNVLCAVPLLAHQGIETHKQLVRTGNFLTQSRVQKHASLSRDRLPRCLIVMIRNEPGVSALPEPNCDMR